MKHMIQSNDDKQILPKLNEKLSIQIKSKSQAGILSKIYKIAKVKGYKFRRQNQCRKIMQMIIILK